jgi:ATP-binding cassette subfamily F protein 3
MEALSTKTLELFSGRPHRLFYGNYAYYLDRVARDAAENEPLSPAEGSDRNSVSKPPAFAAAAASAPGEMPGGLSAKPLEPDAPPPEADVPPRGVLPKTVLVKAGEQTPLSASEKREKDKQRQAVSRRLERRESEVLRKLEELENEKNRLEEELSKPEVYSSGEKARKVKNKLDETAAALEAKSREWEIIAEERAKIFHG